MLLWKMMLEIFDFVARIIELVVSVNSFEYAY